MKIYHEFLCAVSEELQFEIHKLKVEDNMHILIGEYNVEEITGPLGPDLLSSGAHI